MAAVESIGTPPSRYVIPVTRGADRKFTLRRVDSTGAPKNWDASVFIDIDLNRTTPTRVPAQVVDDEAIVRIESSVLDQVRDGMTWRILRSTAEEPSLETPVAVGTFERHDG